MNASSSRTLIRQSSNASRRTRLWNRAAALAVLEGRQGPVAPMSRYQHRNFMSMSDDEDDEDDDVDSVLPHSDTESDYAPFVNPSSEPEDIVLPAAEMNSLSPSYVSRSSDGDNVCGCKVPQRRLKRKSKAAKWFPLKSFIDLYSENDDDYGASWAWRSNFIQVSTLS